MIACTLAALLAFAAPPEIAIVHVTVIDATGSAEKKDRSVLIVGDKIAAIQRSKSFKVPSGATVVDGTGKFLIPGLCDMHVHWYDADTMDLFTANGVTGVRVMWGMPMHKQWRESIRSGKLVGPDMMIGSPIVDGPKPIWPGSIGVKSQADGVQVVDRLKKEGWDFVKVYSLLPRDSFMAIAAEAKAQKIDFEGHVPIAIAVEDAVNAGQKSIEHLTQWIPSCSTEERTLIERPAPRTDMKLRRAQGNAAVDTFSEAKARALADLVKRRGSVQCPTLTVLRAIASLDDPNFVKDDRLQYMPPYLRAVWNPQNDFRLKSFTQADWDLRRREFALECRIVGILNARGAPIIAGTDCLNPYCFPGFSLHDELKLLVKCGLAPMKALQAATRNAASFAGWNAGTVEVGKLANLVLLHRDPLVDIANTTSIAAVFQHVRMYDRAALDAMLAKAKAAAKSLRGGLPARNASSLASRRGRFATSTRARGCARTAGGTCGIPACPAARRPRPSPIRGLWTRPRVSMRALPSPSRNSTTRPTS